MHHVEAALRRVAAIVGVVVQHGRGGLAVCDVQVDDVTPAREAGPRGHGVGAVARREQRHLVEIRVRGNRLPPRAT